MFNFQCFVNADDIRDFQIEGVSVGESILNYKDLNYVRNILKDKNTFYYKNRKYAVINLNVTSNLFDYVAVTIKPKDKKYIIYAIEGTSTFPNQFKSCKVKMKKISNDILSMFPGKDFRKIIKKKHDYDRTGKSFFDANIMDLQNGSIEIFCINWSNKISKEKNFQDELKLGILKHEFREWVNTQAFN